MKPTAAIWQFKAHLQGGKGAGDYPVAIVDTFTVPGQLVGGNIQAVIVDAAGAIRNVAIGELRVVDQATLEAIDEAAALVK